MYVEPPLKERFKVIVNSTQPSSLEDLRRLYPGRPDLPCHDEMLLRFHLDASLESVRPVMGEIECVIKRFKYETVIHKDDARTWAKKNGCRYPFPWERDAFFEAHPEIPGQKGDRIVDFGSIMENLPSPIADMYGDKHVCVRELSGHPGARIFTSSNMETISGIYCFLFVRL